MKLDLVFKDVRPSEALADRIEAKFDKIERMLRRSPPVHVTLSKTKTGYKCTATFHHKGKEFVADGEGDDLFVAADEALHRLDVQVTKLHERSLARRVDRSARDLVDA